jgi:preprotein translocase subunit Sec61beta
MIKPLFFVAGLVGMWGYNHIDPATLQMIIGLAVGLIFAVLVIMAKFLWDDNLKMASELAEYKQQLAWSEERRKIVAQRRYKPSMRKGRA